MKMLLIFIDGLGLGETIPEKNPVFSSCVPVLKHLLGYKESPVISSRRITMHETETTLGTDGLPQSATGQTALFTGVNAPSILGRHLSGQPTPTLTSIIRKSNLFKKLISMGLDVTNSNVYRQEYLNKMLDGRDRRNRPSVTSVMCLSQDIPFRTVDNYREGTGIYHDITGKILGETVHGVNAMSPDRAADSLYRISRNYDFTLFEHFMTDIAGHSTNPNMAAEVLEILDRFLHRLFELTDDTEDIIVITSDHGNIEDISVRTHTMNKVPTVIAGRIPGIQSIKINDLTQVTPAVIEIFRNSFINRYNKGEK